MQLRRVARQGSGHTPSRSRPDYWENCTIPWFTLADIGQVRDGTRTTVTETKECISDIGLANSAAELHPAGTVVLSRTASVGFSAILGRPMATSQDFATWTCGPRILPRFLLYALRGLRDEILGLRMGSTHQTIYMPDIERIRVPLPTLEEQQAIADFLDAETVRIDLLIRKRQRLIVLMQERRTTVRAAAFKADRIWKLKRLLRDGMAYGVLVPRFVEPGAGSRMVRTNALTRRGRVDSEKLAWIEDSQSEQYRRTILAPGDLILSVVGSMGRAAIVDKQVAGANLNRPLARLQPRDELPTALLWHWTQTPQFLEQAALATGGDTAQPTLNLGDLAEFEVALPADPAMWPNVLEQIEKDVQRVDRAEALMIRQVALLQEHRQALITAAVTGELDVAAAA